MDTHVVINKHFPIANRAKPYLNKAMIRLLFELTCIETIVYL